MLYKRTSSVLRDGRHRLWHKLVVAGPHSSASPAAHPAPHSPPRSTAAGQPPPDPVDECLAELERPLPHILVADDDAARSQQSPRPCAGSAGSRTTPNCVADDLGRKPVAGVAGEGRRCHPIRLRGLARHSKPPTWRCQYGCRRAIWDKPPSNPVVRYQEQEMRCAWRSATITISASGATSDVRCSEDVEDGAVFMGGCASPTPAAAEKT